MTLRMKVSVSATQTAYTRQRIEYWDRFARENSRWQPFRRYYQQQLARRFSFSVPPGMRVLEIGSGTGDLLAAFRPAYGVGVDFSPEMTRLASERHPEYRFITADAHDFELGEKFDVIVCSDLINDLWDAQTVLERIAAHSQASTRLLLNFYSRLWEGPRKIAEALGLVKQLPVQNWFAVEDVINLLYLSGFEALRHSREIMCPVRVPLVDTVANKYVARVWPFGHFAVTNIVAARLQPDRDARGDATVSVIVAARNEEGNVPAIFDRMPMMGLGTELIVVEGGSTDKTYEAVKKEIAARPGFPAKLYWQSGKGKGDAVRLGFSKATGEVLMILDADLTVPPEDLPRFYEAWRSGKADFVNGVRLVYPRDDKAMRFLNLVANKFFSVSFSWLLSQTIKDTLCGTKALDRKQYETIAANRSYFGASDPFGDFDLILGAAKYNLKMLDLPVRYRERVYGVTNIQRWRHGWLLIRMVILALRRIKFV